jgi:hypothetical protein
MEVYKVAVHLGMTSNAPAFLAALSNQLLGVETRVKGLVGQFNRLHQVIGGGLALVGGIAALKGLEKMAGHGKELLDQQDKLQRAGLTLGETLGLQANYFDKIGKSIPTATAAEYLRTVSELRAVTGSLAGAEGLAPRALMVDTLLSNTFGHEMHGEYYKLLRSAEMKGISTDPDKLKLFTDLAFSYITAFTGKLSANDYQTLARRGGAAFMNSDLQKSLGPISILAADLGGPAAGTALMSLYQLQTGAMTLSKQQARMFQELGLLDMSKVTPTGFGGSRYQLQPGAIAGSTQYANDLPGWIQNLVFPAIQKLANGDKGLEQSYLNKLAPNRNAAKLIMMFGDQGFRDQIAKDLGLAGQVKPIQQAYSDFIGRNPKGVEAAYEAQKASMLQAIGAPLMQAAIPVMKAMTDLFNKIGEFASNHPTAIKAMGIAFGSLAVGLTALGAVLIGTAVAGAVGVSGGIIAGVAAAATALGAAYLMMKDLDWTKMWNGIVESVQSGLKSIVGAFQSFIQSIMGAFSGFHLPSWLGGGAQKSHFMSPPVGGGRSIQVHTRLNVDGKQLAYAVSEHQVAMATHPNSIGAQDSHGSYMHPGTFAFDSVG